MQTLTGLVSIFIPLLRYNCVSVYNRRVRGHVPPSALTTSSSTCTCIRIRTQYTCNWILRPIAAQNIPHAPSCPSRTAHVQHFDSPTVPTRPNYFPQFALLSHYIPRRYSTNVSSKISGNSERGASQRSAQRCGPRAPSEPGWWPASASSTRLMVNMSVRSWLGVVSVVLSVVGVCSGGDSVHKRGSGVRGGGAGAAAVPGPALVLHGRLHPQVLRWHPRCERARRCPLSSPRQCSVRWVPTLCFAFVLLSYCMSLINISLERYRSFLCC